MMGRALLRQSTGHHRSSGAVRHVGRGAWRGGARRRGCGRVPRLSAPPLRVVRIAPELFGLGVEEHRVEGQTLRMCGVARTIADCFRFRNTVGLDVALEALAEAWRAKRLNIDELHKIATKLRVQRVMQPYLEAIVL